MSVTTGGMFGACGCSWPRHGHDDGCGWQLDLEHRRRRREDLERRPLLAPGWSPDDQLQALLRLPQDADYARKLANWYAEQVAA